MRGYSASIAAILSCDGQRAGAGVVVDRRRVLTCAHVVTDALGIERGVGTAPNLLVAVEIPLRDGGGQSFCARIANLGWIPEMDAPEYGVPEDLALLELIDGFEFPANVAAARLASVDLSDALDRGVVITGFPGGDSADRLKGVVQGIDDRGRIQVDPETLQRSVAGGFSGAGLLDIATGRTVALLVTKRVRGGATIAYAMPMATVARAEEFDLPLLPDPDTRAASLPSLPRNYVSREAFLAPLRDTVLSGLNAGVVSSSPAALKGMGGLGKTVLVKALIHDPDVSTAFGGERYWIAFGAERNPVDAQASLLEDLTSERLSIEHVTDGNKALRSALADRPRLIVLDDVWTADQAAAFDDLGDTATIIVTTRHSSVLNRLGAEPMPLDVLDVEQSRELLAAWASIGDPANLPAVANGIIAKCGRLPLALAIFGAAVSSADITWDEGLDALRSHELEDLSRPIRDYENNEGVFGAIALSFGTLSHEDQAAFARCAVFPEDRPIPFAALSALWHNLPKFASNARSVRRLCLRLEDASLWTRGETEKTGKSYRIHDLVSDYLHARLQYPQEAHRAILEGYTAATDCNWAEVEDDGYLFAMLPTHMRLAGDPDRLRRTLLDFGWLQRKLSVCGARAVASDMKLLPEDAPVSLLGRAMRMSAHVLDREPDQLAAQLLGRLDGTAAGHEFGDLLKTCRRVMPPNVSFPRQGRHLFSPGPLLETWDGHAGRVNGARLLADGR